MLAAKNVPTFLLNRLDRRLGSTLDQTGRPVLEALPHLGQFTQGMVQVVLHRRRLTLEQVLVVGDRPPGQMGSGTQPLPKFPKCRERGCNRHLDQYRSIQHDLPDVFGPPGGARPVRLITFFGMIPNFEPELILPRLAGLVHGDDWLLLSANLAPGPDYAAGAQRILPGYDNPLTRDWLTAFLFDLGFAPGDGAARFAVEDSAAGYKRVAADFYLTRRRALAVYGEPFEFGAGDKIRLFFSYRYTPDRMRALLQLHQLEAREQWVAPSGEEGVFLCHRA